MAAPTKGIGTLQNELAGSLIPLVPAKNSQNIFLLLNPFLRERFPMGLTCHLFFVGEIKQGHAHFSLEPVHHTITLRSLDDIHEHRYARHNPLGGRRLCS